MILTAKTENFTMDYCRFGSGERAFVIIPGLSTAKLTPLEPVISAQYAALTDEFTVYMFDRRNELPEKYSNEEMAADTALVIRQLGLKSICLCASSQGGMIAQVLAAENPDLVEKLILASSSSKPNEVSTAVITEWISLAEEGRGEELNAAMIERVYSRPFIEANADAMKAAIVPMSEAALKRFITVAEPIIDFDFYDRLGEIKCETFVVGSDGDRVLTGPASVEIAEKLGCKLFMYDDSYGHAAYDEAPDFVDRIYRFVTGK